MINNKELAATVAYVMKGTGPTNLLQCSANYCVNIL